MALMLEATERDPMNADNWSHLGAAQYMTGDPGMSESFRRFVALADKRDPESAARARSIQAFLDRGAARRRAQRKPPRSPQE